MRFNLKESESIYLRYKIAEIYASRRLKAILTTKYPPEILNTESFNEMPTIDKEFLLKYWTTFDIFKPLFEINNEIPFYKDFILYEVKSIALNEKNMNYLIKPSINISFNQKTFFDECIEKNISVKIFVVYFLENWEIEYKEFNYEEVTIYVKPHSAWQEEKMKRIKSSKLNQFWHDLFPNYVLYKASEEDLEKEQQDFYQKGLSGISISTPLTDDEKNMLTRRAVKTGRNIPKFDDDIDSMLTRRLEKNKLKQKDRIKPINHGGPWDDNLDDELYKLYSNGKVISEIAKYFGRSHGSIKSRLVRIGLINEKI